ncbi:cytosine permease [Advenella kashmirensis]
MSGFRSLVIMQFLSGLGAMLGPLYGILMVDYFLIRKTRCHIPDLYTEDRCQHGPGRMFLYIERRDFRRENEKSGVPGSAESDIQ